MKKLERTKSVTVLPTVAIAKLSKKSLSERRHSMGSLTSLATSSPNTGVTLPCLENSPPSSSSPSSLNRAFGFRLVDKRTQLQLKFVYYLWNVKTFDSKSRKLYFMPFDVIEDIASYLVDMGAVLKKGSTAFTDDTLVGICELVPNVVELDVSGNNELSNTQLSIIAENMSSVQTLSLRRTMISDNGLLCCLPYWASLLHLDLGNTGGRITDASLFQIAQCSPGLQQLSVRFTNGAITDAGIIAVAKKCTDLRHLAVSNTDGAVTDKSLQEVAKYCSNLRTLDVSSTAGKITNIGLTAIALGCPGLKNLDVSNETGMTDEGIMKIAKHCTGLRHLNARYTGGSITDRGISEIAWKCPYLLYMDVYSTEGKITSVSLDRVQKYCKMLQELYVGAPDGSRVDMLHT